MPAREAFDEIALGRVFLGASGARRRSATIRRRR
jgi:hypothetical protein